jgi:endonuclease I
MKLTIISTLYFFIINNIFFVNSFSNALLKFVSSKFSAHKNLGYGNARKILHTELSDIIIYGSKIKNNNEIIYDKNCEHIWSKNYFEYKEPMISDLHILYLCNSKLNSHRQSYKFNEIKSNYTLLDNNGEKINEKDIFIEKYNIFNRLNLLNNYCKKDTRKKIFEPPNRSKGKIARACAYFYIVYPEYSKYLPKLIDKDIMTKWNNKYIVDFKEIYKNELIYFYQRNKNPFIKYPILMNIIFMENMSILEILKLTTVTFFTIIISIFINLFIKIKFLLFKDKYFLCNDIL